MDRLPETITIGREQMEQAAALAAVLQRGDLRDPLRAPIAAAGLSYQTHRHGAYMRPHAARALRESLAPTVGDERAEQYARQYLRGRDPLRVFAQPDTDDVHVDAILTEISVRYQNSMYIGGQVFPRVQVSKPSDKYFTFTKSDWVRHEARERGPGARAASGGYNLSSTNYSCINWAFEHQVPDEIRAAADSPLDPYSDGVAFATDRIDMALEKAVKGIVFTAGSWTSSTTLSGSTQWSHADSDPLGNFSTARLAVLSLTGLYPNTMVLGVQVFEKLCLHADLLDRIKYSGTQERPAAVTAQMIAQLAMVDNVLVGAAIEDTAYEGATDSLGFIWGKMAWMGYVSPQPARNRPSAGYTFTMGRVSDSYREDATKSDIVRCEEEWDVKAVAADCGYHWTDAVA